MNAIVKAWEEWQKGHPETFDITTLGADKKENQFLANRLYHAFMAGEQAGEAVERQRMLERIRELLTK